MKLGRPISPFFIFALLGLMAIAAMASGCDAPSDTVDYGALCLPATDGCPATTELARQAVGRNGLELTVTIGDSTDTARLRVSTDVGLSFPEERPVNDAGHTILVEREYTGGSGEVITDILSPYELSVASDLDVELTCQGLNCDHRVEYLHILEPLECVDSDSCSRGEFCQHIYGRCAECAEDDDCAANQTCEVARGRCFPGTDRGCIAAGSTGVPPWWLALIATALILSLRQRRHLPAILVASAIFLVAMPAHSATDAAMKAGGGMRLLTGEAGAQTGVGWGLTVAQQLRRHRVGIDFEISTFSLPITDFEVSDSANLTGYGVGLGPRLFIPLPLQIPFISNDRPLEATFAVDYTLIGVADNRLAATTGLGLTYHALGPTLGIGWQWAGFQIGLQANYSHIFGWPGGIFTLDLTAGIGE